MYHTIITYNLNVKMAFKGTPGNYGYDEENRKIIRKISLPLMNLWNGYTQMTMSNMKQTSFQQIITIIITIIIHDILKSVKKNVNNYAFCDTLARHL